MDKVSAPIRPEPIASASTSSSVPLACGTPNGAQGHCSVQCHCAWSGPPDALNEPTVSQPQAAVKLPRPKETQASESFRLPHEHGVRSFRVARDLPLRGQPIRVGKVWHMGPSDNVMESATLRLYVNGFTVIKKDKTKPAKVSELSIAWSPFTIVQACRLHSQEADVAFPWLRLFKVAIFHYGEPHYFAPRTAAHNDSATSVGGKLPSRKATDEDIDVEQVAKTGHGSGAGDPDMERVRWVADTARCLRNFSASLFPAFQIVAEPIPDNPDTQRRLLAGYMLLCRIDEVSLVYLELNAYYDGCAEFVAYEDENCSKEILNVNLDVQVSVTERVGVDCSCFSVGGYNFAARTVAEKVLWLRVISNVKVKMKHGVSNPTPEELLIYRSSITDSIQRLGDTDSVVDGPLLPRCPKGNTMVTMPLEDLSDAAEDFADIPIVAQEDEECSSEPSPGLSLEDLAKALVRPNPRFMGELSAKPAILFQDPSIGSTLGDNFSEEDRSLLRSGTEIREPAAEPEPYQAIIGSPDTSGCQKGIPDSRQQQSPIASLPRQSMPSAVKSPSSLSTLPRAVSLGDEHHFPRVHFENTM